jgi:hypothetical protein
MRRGSSEGAQKKKPDDRASETVGLERADVCVCPGQRDRLATAARYPSTFQSERLAELTVR